MTFSRNNPSAKYIAHSSVPLLWHFPHYSVSGVGVPSCSVSGFLITPWWRHQMEKMSALLTIVAGNSPVTGEFPAQRPVTRSFCVFLELRLNKFETPSRPSWRHSNGTTVQSMMCASNKVHGGVKLVFACLQITVSIHYIGLCDTRLSITGHQR